MEIYRRKSNKVLFEAPDASTSVQATGSLNGSEPIALVVDAPVPGSRTRIANIPFVMFDGNVKIVWRFNATTFNGNEMVEVSETYNVVTPILSSPEIKKVWDDATDDEVVGIEHSVRHIINAHTGQDFGKYVGVIKVRGSNSGSLRLPRRLMSTSLVNGSSNSFYEISGDGFYLTYYPGGVPPVRADYYGLHMHRGGVIHNPNHVRMGSFLDSQVYEIHGEWGYDEVPAPVKEAAMLLVNDYASEDTAYRDRYLTSMTAADWRIQFNSGAFAKTGNVRADQLLSDYVLQRGWAVI